MTDRLRALYYATRWRLNRGVTLTETPTASDGEMQALVACLHPPGSWSYCTGGYRYCLRCMKVRVRC